MPLALVSTFFCTPVFSLVSYIDTDQFTAEFSATYSPSYVVSNCFDGAFGTDCASMNDSNLSIVFNEPVNISDFHISPSSAASISYDYFSVDGVNYPFSTYYDTFSLENVTNIIIYSRSDSLIYFSEISFDFEIVDVVNGVSDNDITEGINWSLFAYSFTVVTFFSMLGRGVKSVIDLIKYG
jgi:hypothetical protein